MKDSDGRGLHSGNNYLDSLASTINDQVWYIPHSFVGNMMFPSKPWDAEKNVEKSYRQLIGYNNE